MLPGFPKRVTKTRLGRGRYRLEREDGFVVEVVRGTSGWWFGRTGRVVKSLGVAEYDVRHGFTAHDQIAARVGPAYEKGGEPP